MPDIGGMRLMVLNFNAGGDDPAGKLIFRDDPILLRGVFL